jgi:predicted enzyme related to lactoylglutathione lyase
MIKHIAFMVYPVTDMARARAFYEKTLGLTLTKDFRSEWVEYHLDNGCFAITTMMKNAKPGAGLSFEVDDVDKTVKELEAKGATIKVKPFSTPVCRNAIIVDPDGNGFGLHQKTVA